MSGKLLLGLDTATEYLALALVTAAGPAAGHAGGRKGSGAATSPADAPAGGAEVARFVERLGREHATRIVGEIAALLERAGAAREDVAAIGVGVGPGSYTGVRVGIATARALGRAWGVPVGGSPSLLALLGPALAPGERGLALLDARKGNVYALLAARTASAWPGFEPLEGPLKLPRAELDARFGAVARFEGEPDAAILARRAGLGGALDAFYL